MAFNLRNILIGIAALWSAFAWCQQNTALCSERPRLVLFIIVDELNPQQLDIVQRRCKNGGFNRIIYQGTEVQTAYYDAGAAYVGKNMATLFTGADAGTHGIVGEQWVDRYTHKRCHALYGEAYDHNGRLDSAAVASTGRLLCSTLGTEIRKVYNNEPKIVSIGFREESLAWLSGTKEPEATIVFNPTTGRWDANNLRSDTLQKAVDSFNAKNLSDFSLTKIWAPKYDINEYHENRYFKDMVEQRTFYYNMQPKLGRKRYGQIVGTPFANTLLRDFAVGMLIADNFGKDDIPDVMVLEFCGRPSVGKRLQPIDAETEDLLLTLDETIESLLKFIDYDIGMDNTLVVLTSAQGAYDLTNTKSVHWASWGAVSLRRTTALLNLYLMAKHGQHQWVRGYSGCEIYLDRDTAKAYSVKWETLCTEAAEFMKQVEGVGDAFVAEKLDETYSALPIVDVMRRNYHRRRSGDILLSLAPGWSLELDDGRQLGQLWGFEYVPLSLYGWKVPRQTITERHAMTDVAPTISSFLGTCLPNGATGKALLSL